MNLKSTLLAAAATLIVAAPAMAQDAMTQPAPAPQPAPQAAAPAAPAPTPAQAAIEASAQQFQTRLQTMSGEIGAAIQAAGSDTAKAEADAHAVVDRYAPEFDAFATELETFFDGEIAASTDEAEKAAMTSGKQQAVTEIRGLQTTIKSSISQQITAAAAAPTPAPAPAQPAPTTPPTE